MKFVEEKALKEHFWKKYGYRKNIIAYQFECQARHGGVDLLTVEKVNDDKGFHLELCSFEFKLADIEKAFSQAYLNSEFCHKNFVVVPMDKKKVILDKYSDYLGNIRVLDALVLNIQKMVVDGRCLENVKQKQMLN